ncbi:hypothetical protein A6E92_22175 [Streptomyces sp. S8]|uniref:hypothetical protein n=1 Tax=Streptomyces sp. S8 TaxID=1837283 RepID=UPI000A095BD1|nr:hypothetical protein [Streptomyces sp. S8]ARI54573.1 hypothetical protein A6E92_22175 [Streptomyces sp. S8]
MTANDLTEAEAFGPVGYIARSLAHLRAGHPIAELDEAHVLYAAPTQADVDNARHMAGRLSPQPATGPGRRPASRIRRSG